jgi:hypothetical protein
MTGFAGETAASKAEAGTAQLRPKRSAGNWPFLTFLKTAIRLMPSIAAASGIEKYSLAILHPYVNLC